MRTPAERSILFSGAMVRALLAGTKTQTRRALRDRHADRPPSHRFGRPGDRLWVRETFYAFGRWETRFNAGKQREEWYFVDMTRQSGLAYRYEADLDAGAIAHARREAGAAPAWHKRPALFMPRVASRILLEVAGVRVERLQDISDSDAVAEGIRRIGDAFERADAGDGLPGTTPDPVLAYRGVWERINGVGSWAANPLVWVVEFRRVLPWHAATASEMHQNLNEPGEK
jgi:hypothetical protein